MKKLLSYFLLTLLTITSFNIAAAQQVGDTDDGQGSCIDLSYNMRFRSRDANTNGEVSDLQDFLISEGYMTGNTTGYFGALTLKAVKSFQTNNNLISSGIVGAVTRAKIKSMSCSGTNNPVAPVFNDPVVISPINGMLNVTYYKLNQSGDKCTSVLFIGNRGDNVVNGKFVYLSGQYKNQADCEASSNLINNNLKVRVVDTNGNYNITRGSSAQIIIDGVSENAPSGFVDFVNSSTGVTYSLYDLKLTKGQNIINWQDTSNSHGVRGDFGVPVPAGTYTPYVNVNGKNINGPAFTLSDSNNKKITITSAIVEQLQSGQINVSLAGSGFRNGATMRLGNCASGSPASFSTNSDTDTSTGYEQTYFFGCVTPGTFANVLIEGNGVGNSNTYSLYIPATLKNPASVTAYNVLGNEMLGQGAIYTDQVQGLDGNKYILNRVDVTKGSYSQIKIKLLCGTLLDRNNNTTSNFGLSGKIKFGEASNYFNYFSCPADLVSVTKGNTSTYQTEWHVTDVTKARESITAEVTSSDTWGETNYGVGKNQPVGVLQFYGVKSDGSTELIKSMVFLFSIKG